MCECGAVVEWKTGDLGNTVRAPPVLVLFLTDDAGLTVCREIRYICINFRAAGA